MEADPSLSLKLFFSPGSCSRVPLIALEETGAPFETKLVALMAGEHRTPDYLALNPAGKIPTLLAGGVPITQNLAIQYLLAMTFPEAGLLPFTGNARRDAYILTQLAWISGDLHPLVSRIRMPHLACDTAPARVKEMAASGMTQQLGPLERRLGHQQWLLEEGWSTLDAYFNWVWWRITGAGFEDDAFPNIAAHAERMMARPSVKRAILREQAAEEELAARGLTVGFVPSAKPES